MRQLRILFLIHAIILTVILLLSEPAPAGTFSDMFAAPPTVEEPTPTAKAIGESMFFADPAPVKFDEYEAPVPDPVWSSAFEPVTTTTTTTYTEGGITYVQECGPNGCTITTTSSPSGIMATGPVRRVFRGGRIRGRIFGGRLFGRIRGGCGLFGCGG